MWEIWFKIICIKNVYYLSTYMCFKIIKLNVFYWIIELLLTTISFDYLFWILIFIVCVLSLKFYFFYWLNKCFTEHYRYERLFIYNINLHLLIEFDRIKLKRIMCKVILNCNACFPFLIFFGVLYYVIYTWTRKVNGQLRIVGVNLNLRTFNIRVEILGSKAAYKNQFFNEKRPNV